MTDLEQAFAEFESRFTVVDGTPSSRSQTGERYREFVTLARVSLDETVANLIALAEAYAATKKGGTLYWRVRPETIERRGLFYGYIRLLISDKPQIEGLKQAA